MNRLQKALAPILAAALLLTGCSAQGSEVTQNAENHTYSIVCTIFPEYDWMREIVGDGDFEVTCLLKNGADLHNYQPTADDMVKIADCDIFVYVGGESDEWAEDALAEAHKDSRQVISLLDTLGAEALEEEEVEGMQPEEEEEEEGALDEHLWLSPAKVLKLLPTLQKAVMAVDPDHSMTYVSNATVYQNQLTILDVNFQKLAEAHPDTTLIFADRFPFRYLMDECGFSYYAAFSGCSAETEASFETIAFLADKVDELNAGFVCVLESSDCSIAEAVIRSTKTQDQQIITLNSLQSVTAVQAEEGVTYLSAMQENYETLKEALET